MNKICALVHSSVYCIVTTGKVKGLADRHLTSSCYYNIVSYSAAVFLYIDIRRLSRRARSSTSLAEHSRSAQSLTRKASASRLDTAKCLPRADDRVWIELK